MTDMEAKRLKLELKANEDKYVSGELDLLETLLKTDKVYKDACKNDPSASRILQDSSLMYQHAKITRESVKRFQPDSLVFDPVQFSTKLKQHMSLNLASSDTSSEQDDDCSSLWIKVGEKAKTLLCTVPTFQFIYGTFDPDPVEIAKKQRKARVKEKLADVTQPQTVDVESAEKFDFMLSEAERLLSLLIELWKRSEAAFGKRAICYFEFVTDPHSFAHTVENIFIVSLLVKEGRARIVADKKGLPCLVEVSKEERDYRNLEVTKQFAISISHEEWKMIVKKLNLTKPLIPARSSKRK